MEENLKINGDPRFQDESNEFSSKQSNRRNFLKAGATLGAGLIAVPAFSSINANEIRTSEQNASKQNNIEQRTLGTGVHSLKVSALGLGCMGMSWNRTFIPNRKDMIPVIRKAYEMGVTLFDTAEAYGPFVNEELVGEAIAPFRKEITLCSKFGFKIENGKMVGGFNSKPEHIRSVVEQSLKRLKTDVIDLLYQHRVDPNVPMEDVAGTVKDLIKEGKVKHFGLSEAGAESIRKAHAVQPITALQTEYSLMTRNPEEDVFKVCEELGIGFVPYSPLCRAYLTGYINERTKYDPSNDNRASLPRYQPDAVKANWVMIDVLTQFGNQRGLTAAQVSLAWLLAQKPWIVPIPGTTKLAHLQENLWSADFKFTSDELKALTEAISKIKVVGDRYATPQTR
jgi:aryl-alcohol dehydrogenase-like predicted oxidoreductase